MKTLVAFLLAILSLPVHAQGSGWHLGIAAGSSRAGHALVADREATIGNGDEPGLQSAADLRDGAARLFAGYRFTPALSIEAGYARLGRQRIDTSFEVPFGRTGRGAVLTERRLDGWGLDLVAGAPVLSRLRVFCKAGAFRARARSDTTISGDTSFADATPGTFRSRSASETVAKFGLGAEYEITARASARFEWERHRDAGTRLEPGATNATGEASQDAWWLGIVLRF